VLLKNQYSAYSSKILEIYSALKDSLSDLSPAERTKKQAKVKKQLVDLRLKQSRDGISNFSKWLENLVKETLDKSVNNVNDRLKAFGESTIEKSDLRISKISDRAIKKTLALHFSPKNNPMKMAVRAIQKTINSYGNIVGPVLTKAISRGASMSEIARDLYLNSDNTINEDAFRVDGRLKKIPWKAKQIARTEVNRISNLTEREVGSEIGAEYGLWIGIVDDLSGKDTLLRVGHLMKMSEWETFKDPWGFEGLPPLRPNDRCNVSVYKKEWFDNNDFKRLYWTMDKRLAALAGAN
jgi:hypothetical protein